MHRTRTIPYKTVPVLSNFSFTRDSVTISHFIQNKSNPFTHLLIYIPLPWSHSTLSVLLNIERLLGWTIIASTPPLSNYCTSRWSEVKRGVIWPSKWLLVHAPSSLVLFNNFYLTSDRLIPTKYIQTLRIIILQFLPVPNKSFNSISI